MSLTPDDRVKLIEEAANPEKTPFEYVIVGSGAGGGPLAARLARAGRRVLLLEAGGDHTVAGPGGSDQPSKEVPEVQRIPGYHAVATEDPDISWGFSVRHYANDARQAKDSKY